MTIPSISVVIPVYNGGEFLRKTISSVLKQEGVKLEVIVIDDASDVETKFELRALVAENPITLVTHRENQGLASSLNDGLRLANYEFVLTLHQDCELIPKDWLLKAVQVFRSEKNIGVVTGWSVWDTCDFGFIEKAFMVINRHRTLEPDEYVVDIPFAEDKCDLYRKDLLMLIGGFPERKFRISGEDQYVSEQLRKQGYRVVACKALTYRQRYGLVSGGLHWLLGKSFVFGRNLPHVLRHVGLSILRIYMRDKRQIRERTLNRMWSLLNGFIILLSPLGLLFLPLFLPFALEVVFRFAYFACKAVQSKLFSSLFECAKVGVIGVVFDIVFTVGVIYGLALLMSGEKS